MLGRIIGEVGKWGVLPSCSISFLRDSISEYPVRTLSFWPAVKAAIWRSSMALVTFFAMSERRNSFCDGRFLKSGPGGIGGGGNGRSPSLPGLPGLEETHLICPNRSSCRRCCCGNWHPRRVSLEFKCNCRIVRSRGAAEQAAEGLASRIDLKSGLMAAPREVGLERGEVEGERRVGGMFRFHEMSLRAWRKRKWGKEELIAPPMTNNCMELGIAEDHGNKQGLEST